METREPVYKPQDVEAPLPSIATGARLPSRDTGAPGPPRAAVSPPGTHGLRMAPASRVASHRGHGARSCDLGVMLVIRPPRSNNRGGARPPGETASLPRAAETLRVCPGVLFCSLRGRGGARSGSAVCLACGVLGAQPWAVSAAVSLARLCAGATETRRAE